MDITDDRIINGLLKGFGGSVPPDALKLLLSQDVEIIAPPHRATFDDLWPAIWALAAVLERQHYGQVFIRCGLSAPLPAPAALGSRCVFTTKAQHVALSIGIGITKVRTKQALIGDARSGVIAVGKLLPDGKQHPSPIECFMVAGYLGFAALATLVQIPEYRTEFARPNLIISCDPSLLKQRIAETSGFTCIGLGQLGQAFLALLFFLHRGNFSGQKLILIDRDTFEIENGRTQILLSENAPWLNEEEPITKVQFIGDIVNDWHTDVIPRRQEIQWGWTKEIGDPDIALVGLDDLEVRRMVMAAGFNHIIEAGVGTDFLRPRISWHAVPGNPVLGRHLFPNIVVHEGNSVSGDWVEALKRTPGQCGWVRFQNIAATAPSLGIAATAFALSELGHQQLAILGRATLWPPCLPILREPVSKPAAHS